MRIGEKIKRIRRHKGMTQSNLVKGIASVPYLSKVENDKTKPSKNFIDKISERLGLNSGDLINDDSNDNLITRLNEIYKQYKNNEQALKEEDINYLHLNVHEIIPNHVSAKVISLLLQYYISHNKTKEADDLFTTISNIFDVHDLLGQENNADFYYFYKSIGGYFYTKQYFQEADYYYTNAEQVVTEEEDIEKAKLFYNLGLVKQRVLEDKSVSLMYTKRALSIFKKQKQHINVIKAIINLAVQYELMDHFNESLKTLYRAQKLMVQEGVEDLELEFTIESNIASVFHKTGDYEQAIFHYNKNLNIIETLNREKDKIYAYRGLLYIYIELKYWDLVKYYLTKSLEITHKYDLPYLQVELLATHGRIYKWRGDKRHYEEKLKKTIEYGIEKKQQVLVKSISEELGNYYYDNRFYKKAAYYLRVARGIYE